MTSLYPLGEERQRINAAMRELIAVLRDHGVLAKAFRVLGGAFEAAQGPSFHLCRGANSVTSSLG